MSPLQIKNVYMLRKNRRKINMYAFIFHLKIVNKNRNIKPEINILIFLI